MTYPEIKRIRSLLTATKKCIAKLPNLECLRVSKTGSPVSESYCSGNDKAPDYNLSLVSELRESLVTVLSTLRFEYLTDLQLNLPCTFDFHAIEKALPGRICSQLRRLYLEYSDCTGPGGSNSYLHYYDEDDDGDYYVPLSNLQNQYLNTDYMSSVTKIVSRCMNLESLGLRGTQHLQMDSLDWKPTRDGLKHIYLDRVAVGQDRLIQLLSPAESRGLEESPLFSTWLEEVHLTSGTWENVFQHLFQCPRLAYLNPQNLNYWRHGSSAEYKYYTCRPWEDCTNIWTCNEDEEDTLFQLLTNLVKKAGGLENYPNEHNELLNEEDQFM
ncbi:hypothetical protein BS50DRAFT_568066 [Corynespora cassiicola Philippines]|uniref:F-box domain-containing protein n=1 Tax=Corynespora cassiicola Philippines TaxID=1448308 RepID=A0A2T2PCQ1_CORCC|nr:hypothetical protein BS50DRAFT_568066 [Corynespora cassiicola Philippines]